MAAHIEPDNPIIREALTHRAVGIASDALAPILDAALARGLTRAEIAEVGRQAVEDGRPGVLDRVGGALEDAIEGRA